ncbi:MAG TPA: ATPase, T2SS/T4P/T4SS family [Gaiellaceae bacterium]|nr:ATPase, T2SS/T4P/T4SS family [Gaiellaceae bacterium]
MAELTLEPQETIRLRLESALATEDVNLASEAGRARTEQLIEEMLRAYEAEALSGQAPPLESPRRAEIAAELRNELIGLGALAERMLADPLAQEWMINGPKRIFRDTGERIERVPDLVYEDDRQVRAFVERLLEQVEGKRLDRITPRVEARLPDGSRLTAAIPPVSSNGHTICTIRRFRLAAGTLEELVGLGFLSGQAASFLTACVYAGKNIVVAGRVSSGKTTLLNALGRAIPGTERVVVCESSAELQLPAILPNCVGYEARPASNDGLPGVTLEDLVADALRMNPDRILVGECRGPETMAMLWSFATGHAGMTSVHGESAEHALRNLVRFALTSGARVEAEQALDWVRDVDLVVHCDRPRSFTGGERRFLPRRIDEIVEVAGVEGKRLTLNPLFEGTGSDLRWLGSGPAYIDELEQAGFHVG